MFSLISHSSYYIEARCDCDTGQQMVHREMRSHPLSVPFPVVEGQNFYKDKSLLNTTEAANTMKNALCAINKKHEVS